MKNQSYFNRVFLLFFFCILFADIQAQWQYVGSPEIGRVLDYDKDMERIYVCATSGLFYSEDNGLSWISIPLPTSISTANEIYAEGDALYLFTRKEYSLGDFSVDLFRSNDKGLTWKNILPFSGYAYNNIFTFHSPVILGDTLLLFADDSIAISTDLGETYSIIKNALGEPEQVIFHGKDLIAIQNNNMYRSGDLGLTWDFLYASPTYLFGLNVLNIGDTIYKIEQSTAGGDVTNYFSMSVDGGYVWIPAGNFTYPFILFPHFLGDGKDLFVIKPFMYDVYFHSPDGGKTWNEVENKIFASDFSYADGILYAHGVDHVQFSKNKGDTFETHDSGFRATNVSEIVTGNNRIWINANTLTFQNAGGNQWPIIFDCTKIQSTIEGTLLALIHGVLSRSDDGGSNWSAIPLSAFGLTSYSSLREIYSSGNIFFAGGSTYWYSLDQGISWELFDEINLLHHGISHTGHDPSHYIVCDYRNSILKSMDGVNWENITYDNYTPGNSKIEMVHSHNGYFFTLTSQGTTRLSPGSTHWELLHNPFTRTNPHSPPAEFNCMVSEGNLLFAGSYGHGVFISYDSGETWKDINSDLYDFQVTALKISNEKLYVGVDGGVWVRSISNLTATEFLEHKSSLILHVSPNPVKDFLNINIRDYGLSGKILLTLYDSKGTTIRLMNIEEGSTLQMDIRDITPGVYYLHTKVDNQAAMVKVVKL